ncbi:MAG: MBL fold metallo-hydrolase [Anaerolineae bacterium]|nr:MBL fold metallo-hydrolase [Anaerolineae bacterium]
MHQLNERLWWVDEAASIVNVYLWDNDGELILFDAGAPWQSRAILRAISRADFAPSDIRHILLTHADLDHIGGARAIREVTGAAIVCHAVTAAILQDRLRRPLGFGVLGKPVAFFYHVLMKSILHAIPLRADVLITDKAKLPGGFQAIYTPGHSPGHTSYFHPKQRVLITGDAIRNTRRGLILPPRIFTPDRANAALSVHKLARLDAEILCPGHGRPITTNAQAQLSALAERPQIQGAIPSKKRPQRSKT